MKNIIVNNISTSYYITEDGKCYNSNTGKYLKGQIISGYLSYNLTLNSGDKKRFYAHKLMAETFIPTSDKNKTQVNHKDGNKLNNTIDNLEWVTPSENQQHALQHELRSYDHVFCFDKNKKLIAEYINIPEASKAAQISYSIIAQELKKEIKSLSGGFYWSRIKELGETKNYSANGKAKVVYQYDLNGKFITSYPSTGIAAKALGLNTSSHIGECCRGKTKTYKGFIWRYADDIFSPSGESQRSIGENA